jgi:hypothetical protein
LESIYIAISDQKAVGLWENARGASWFLEAKHTRLVVGPQSLMP